MPIFYGYNITSNALYEVPSQAVKVCAFRLIGLGGLTLKLYLIAYLIGPNDNNSLTWAIDALATSNVADSDPLQNHSVESPLALSSVEITSSTACARSRKT